MKNKIFITISLGIVGLLTMSSCSDEFLEEKQDYQYVSPEFYQTYDGCLLRVNNLYNWCLPFTNPLEGQLWKTPTDGQNDLQGKSTEEYAGLSIFVDRDQEMKSINGTDIPDYFMNNTNNVQDMVYGLIRNINAAIEGISASTGITQEEKDELLGQCYFFRAWRYYLLMKWYGGVPLVDKVLDPVASSVTYRSSAEETKDFIISDLDKAAALLKAKTGNGGWTGGDYGRVTTGTALALKGRVLALWCSPLFNRKGDTERYKEAYAQMKEELTDIENCGYHLYTDATDINGSAFAKMFTVVANNPEAVFVTLYNSSQADATTKNNMWERNIRPKNTTGSGKNASAMLFDLFPMKDGKIPASAGTYTKLETSNCNYDKEVPFVDRDPRFYRTFAFPGVRWAYNGDPTPQNPDNPKYNDGKDYELWNYVWFTSEEDRDKDNGTMYGADNLLTNVSGVYVRKKSDDYQVNTSPLYGTFDAKNSNGGFALSSAPLMEIRFAEVLLNLAEVACGTGDAGAMSEALQLLRQIRQRVGYTGDCGLSESLLQDQGALMSAILYERQIELAYEGKRFDDLRRWMLYDGGTTMVEGAPESWRLGGIWASGTDQFLGFKALNGQHRFNLAFAVKADVDHHDGIGGKTVNDDPMSSIQRCAAIDLSQPLDAQVTVLANWYRDNLERMERRGDGYMSDNVTKKNINFYAKYYFLGFKSGTLDHHKVVSQTIGWYDTNTSAMGTYDPFAETHYLNPTATEEE